MAAQRLVDILLSELHQPVAGAQAMGVQGRVTAAHADGMHLVHILGHGHQSGHRAERLAKIVHVQSGSYHPDTGRGQLPAHVNYPVVEELGLVYAHHVHIPRQISSSVLPENIEPQMTSIQPGFFAYSENIFLLLSFERMLPSRHPDCKINILSLLLIFETVENSKRDQYAPFQTNVRRTGN